MRFFAVMMIMVLVGPVFGAGDAAPKRVTSFPDAVLICRENTKAVMPSDRQSIGSRLTKAEVRELLKAHNKVRADVGVGPLKWSGELAVYAQEWADRLGSIGCRMKHRPDSGKYKGRYGENLFMGTAGHYDVGDAVDAWEREKSAYGGGPIRSSNYMKVGHYTQMVWRKTRFLGCARIECNGNMIVVCNYDPPGNYLGEKPY